MSVRALASQSRLLREYLDELGGKSTAPCRFDVGLEVLIEEFEDQVEGRVVVDDIE